MDPLITTPPPKERVPFELVTVDRTSEVYSAAYQALPSWKRFFARWTPLFRPEINACFDLVQDWIYISKSGLIYLVPAGLRFDYASIPQEVQSIIPKMGPWNTAAFFHDWLYKSGFFGADGRQKGDDLLLEVMLYYNVDKTTADTIYDGVRVGGASSWAANKELAVHYRELFFVASKNYPQYHLAMPVSWPELVA